jgi:nitrite transporter
MASMSYAGTCDYFAKSAKNKAIALKRKPLSLLAGCMMAGAYIGIALILALTCSAGIPAATGLRPLVTGSVFGIGLLLVVFAGADLFTGYAMYVVFGLSRKSITLLDALMLLVFVWVGNLIGAAIFAWIFNTTGGGVLFDAKPVLHDYVRHKEVVGWLPLLCKGMLANWLVCLAVWTAARVQSETAKMIAIAWCLLAFVGCGFEHSVANMTITLLGLIAPSDVGFGTPALVAFNLTFATLGNLLGGAIFVAGGYLLYSGSETEAAAQAKPVERIQKAAQAA